MKLIKKFLLTKVAQNRVMPCFQVVLEEAKIKEAPKLECPSTPAPSVEDIEKRLKVIASSITIHNKQSHNRYFVTGGRESTKVNGSLNFGEIGPRGKEKGRGEFYPKKKKNIRHHFCPTSN